MKLICGGDTVKGQRVITVRIEIMVINEVDGVEKLVDRSFSKQMTEVAPGDWKDGETEVNMLTLIVDTFDFSDMHAAYEVLDKMQDAFEAYKGIWAACERASK